MGGHWTGIFSYVTGAVARAGHGFLSVSEDGIDQRDEPHSQFLLWRAGSWDEAGGTAWPTVAMAMLDRAKGEAIALGPWGDVLITTGDATRSERMGDGPAGPRGRGPLRGLTVVGGTAFATGMSRQVYRRDGDDRWTGIDAGMEPKETETVGLEAIDGFSPEELYAVGHRGEIWRSSGERWFRVDSPTNIVLTHVLCAPDERVYACGRLGMLLRGRQGNWSVIEHGSTEDDLWRLAWFQGKLYASSFGNVFALEEDKLVPVGWGLDPPSTCYHLATSPDELWSIGGKDVLAWNGAAWTRID